jgi:DNA-binding response OmpR family regulator/7-cyano-7-deazaguanine synthase in queuosine biosynthesis
MCNRHLVLCGGAHRTSRHRSWPVGTTLRLDIGDGPTDVHLRVEHLTRRMCVNLPDVAIDLLELAAYVYAADQAVRRGGTREFEYGSHWKRHFRFEVPVRCPEVWQRPPVVAALTETLGFLSEDDFEFGFAPLANPPPLDRYLFDPSAPASDRDFAEVILFSGGLDSLGGAVREVLQGQRKVALVSHRPVSKVYARQRDLAGQIARRVPRPDLVPLHVAVEVNKGKSLGQDFNQRCRSFLFASVAAVVARAVSIPRVRFYENGVVSLNLPLSPQVLGSRASRTTHPQTLCGFGRIFSLLFDQGLTVENPFLWETKATILQGIKAAGHGDLCALTCSCAHTIDQTVEHAHCGRCSQCVDRRLTALAAGLNDTEDPPAGYATDVLTGPREGADLILVERYVGALLNVSRLEDARAFLTACPEVSRILRHVALPADEAAERARALHRRHAEQVLGALARVIEREAPMIAQWRLPVNSLLAIVCGRGGRCRDAQQTAVGVAAGELPPGATRLVLDPETFEARLGDRRCFLGNTMEFHLLARLNRRPGHYVSVTSLRQDVWRNDETEKNTIQRTVSNLRRRLRDDHFNGLEIDGSQKDNYRLVLPR